MLRYVDHFPISIHAPLTGSDDPCPPHTFAQRHFNPRSPYGERRNPPIPALWLPQFQSTLPLRGATIEGVNDDLPDLISIHAPLTGSDALALILVLNPVISIHAPLTGSDHPYGKYCPPYRYFNPRSPYGERPGASSSREGASRFQSTLPLRGATCTSRSRSVASQQFQSTLPLRGATGAGGKRPYVEKISIHAPLTGSDMCADPSAPAYPISIHAPLTGSDGVRLVVKWCFPLFQSTLPLRGATGS